MDLLTTLRDRLMHGGLAANLLVASALAVGALAGFGALRRWQLGRDAVGAFCRSRHQAAAKRR